MSMQGECALGIFSWFGYRLCFPERLRLIREAGFDATAIWWGDEEELCRDGRGRTMPAMVRDHGLVMDNVHVPFEECNDLWSENSSKRESAVSDHLRWIQGCAECEVPSMVMHVSKGSEMGAPNSHGIESMSRIVEAAERSGVNVVVENTRRVDYLESIFGAIQSPRLRFCYDSGHDWLYGDPPGRTLSRLGSALACTHFSDNNGTQDQHCLPGRGVIDWATIAGSFPSEDYHGSLLLEVVPLACDQPLSPEGFLSEAFLAASRLREMLSIRRNLPISQTG